MSKHLNFGVYEATETFKAIKQHSCVCFDDMTLVAVTGPAEDKESQKYAELFAAAPEMLEALELIANPKNWIRQNGEILWNDFAGNEFMTEHAMDIARAAIAKAKGESVPE